MPSVSPTPATAGTYLVAVGPETFVLRATQPAVVAELEAALASGRQGVLGGTLRRGSGDFNAGHEWHIDPATVFLADVAIELCDGLPSDLDADLSYWVDVVGTYCPWSARVISRS